MIIPSVFLKNLGSSQRKTVLHFPDVNLAGNDIRTTERKTDVLLDVCKDIGLEVNRGKLRICK